uniref:Secernin 3 n=1 Tax=Oncorhynchus kisutch TaxID=8019 RepID=A0A8C7MMF3_ONCKI
LKYRVNRLEITTLFVHSPPILGDQKYWGKLTYMCIKVVKSLVFGPIFIAPKNYIKLVTTNLLDAFAVCFGCVCLFCSQIKVMFVILQLSIALVFEILHGGNRMEDQSGFAYHNRFEFAQLENLQTDMPRAQTGGMSSVSEFSFTETYSFMTTARIDTSGSRYCGVQNLLERSKGHNTAEAMMDILRDKENGINMEGIFMATGSMVSVVLTDPNLPGDPFSPNRSVFKPFVFVKDIKQLKQNSSLGYGPDDTVKKIPCFQSKPHRKHPLFVKHDVDMLKQHLKTSVRKLKLGHKWVFQMDNDPKMA